jgi:hypothetical protein
MPPKRFEGKFGIPPSHPVDSLLTQALYRLPESVNVEQIERLTEEITEKVNSARTQEGLGAPLTEEEKRTLELKLVRHFEDNGESAPIDTTTAVDALVESPRFLSSDKGSMEKLFELHEMKTLQKIAELRRKRAEITASGGEGLNPYENLFETNDGKYYLARLLNMPHLEQESEYMDHCVGTSTSYVNKMKRGEVEILSFRDKETDNPLVTIEYDCKSHRLLQIKAMSDRIPTLADPYAADLIEAIEKLGDTVNDQGEKRIVESKEAQHMRELITLSEKTERKEQLTRDDLVFLYEIDAPIEGFGYERDPRIEEIRQERNVEVDMPIIFECAPELIAHAPSEVTAETKAYIGPWNPSVYQTLKDFPQLTHLYESFPDKKIFAQTLETDPAINSPEKAEAALKAKNIYLSDFAKDILSKTPFSHEGKTYDLVQFTVSQLGFPDGATTSEIYSKAEELDLDLCPAEVGPQLRLSYPGKDWKLIAMEPIADRDGDPGVFSLNEDDGRLELHASFARPDYWFSSGTPFVFCSRKVVPSP